MDSSSRSPWWNVSRNSTGMRLLLEVAGERGVTPDRCLAGTGLTRDRLYEPDAQFDAGLELQVARNLIRRLGDVPGLGADVGSRMMLGSMGMWGYALLSSPTWREAVGISHRYGNLFSAYVRPHFTAEGEDVAMVLDDAEIPADVRDMLAERDLAAALVVLRAIIRPEPLLRFETRFAGARAAALQELAPAWPIASGRPRHVIRGHAGLADEPLPLADRQNWQSSVRDCAALLDRRRERTGFAGHFRSRLLIEPSVRPSMEEIAAELHVAPRTLRRRLAVEGTTFRGLLDEVQAALATELLTATDLTIQEITFRLGYADAISFTHAFKRWTGASPGSFREQA